MEGLRTPIRKIAMVLACRTEGLSFNATCRVHSLSTDTLRSWKDRFGLMSYSLAHSFLSQVVEGDELYTKVRSNVPPDESQGWTVVLIERASRFLWALECGQKDADLFMSVIQQLAQVIEWHRQVNFR